MEQQPSVQRILQGLAGRNFGTLAALILISAPVRGLRPLRAGRLVTANEPNPTSETVPPFFNVVPDGCDGGIERTGRSGLGDVGMLGNMFDEFCLVHKKPL